MTLVAIALFLIRSLVPDAPDPDRLAMAMATAAEERPILGDEDGLRTLTLLVSVAYWETGRTFDGSRVGDRGHSVSPWQLWVCGPGFDESRCNELRANVFESARVARDMLATSMRVCRSLPQPERLSQYTSGRCMTNRESRLRWATAERLYARAREWEVRR